MRRLAQTIRLILSIITDVFQRVILQSLRNISIRQRSDFSDFTLRLFRLTGAR